MSQILGSNFILQQIEKEVAQGLDPCSITLRFPPEPNGYLHIGHARAICLNFELARRFGGRCFVRLDDTNPATESQQFVDAILKEISWLGYHWDALHHTSDYFDQLFDYTVRLIEAGLAYIDDQSPEQISTSRGSLTEAGQASPWRDRSPDENLKLFEAMRHGQSGKIQRVVRARIDMSSTNLNMRDPVIWRQRDESHYRLNRSWKIFPLYDFSHCLSDAIEGITHSLCTLEFADHRPLYDWFLDKLIPGSKRPRQIEFARMNISGILTSKRKILDLCRNGAVQGFDDPRLMTLAGMRRRGFLPEIIRDFCQRTPITRANGDLELNYLFDVARENLNEQAPRAMAVLRPLKVILENLEPDQIIECHSPVYPQNKESKTRALRLTREIYIESDDFSEQPTAKFRRLAPGSSARLRSAGVIHYVSCRKNGQGQIIELRCRLEANSRGAKIDDQGNKVAGTLHWVDAGSSVQTNISLLAEEPVRGHNQAPAIDEAENNANSPADSIDVPAIETLQGCYLEAGLADAAEGDYYQFERLGYFRCLSQGEWLRTMTLRPGRNKSK